MLYRAEATVLTLILLLPGLAPAADAQKGIEAYNIGEYETALAECQPAAEAGDALAQFCVGRMYANGFGVAMNDAQAHKWYGLAAAQGHAEAQFNLAVMNANGWGVPMNDAEAARLYGLAAEQGFTQAQTSLASLYRSGRGVEQSGVEAYRWYAIAAKLGDMNAEFKLDEIAIDLSPDEIAAAEDSANAWLEANNGEVIHAGRVD